MFQNQDQVVDTRIVTLDDAFSRPDMTLVERVSVTCRAQPAFVLDLSGEQLLHHLYYEKPLELGGVFKSEWEDAALFGWNAFHAFVNVNADFTCQDVVGTTSRVDRHLQHLPGAPYRIPGMKRDENVVMLDFTQMPSNLAAIIHQPGAMPC